MSDEIIISDSVEGMELQVDPAQRQRGSDREIEINPHDEVVAKISASPTRRITAKDIKFLLLYFAPFAALGSLIQTMYPQVSAFEKHPILMDMAVVMLIFYLCGLTITALLVFQWTNDEQNLYDRFSIEGLTHIFGILMSISCLLVLVSEEGGRLGLLVFLVVIVLVIFYSLRWIHQLVYVRIYMMQFSEPSTG